mmetsp:Transcript_26035/g.61195  ORF Transcript_26035/g.61195 Transcript_26035/m.61195 type:complete len:93 (+) Transcript_26035:433-711(+)
MIRMAKFLLISCFPYCKERGKHTTTLGRVLHRIDLHMSQKNEFDWSSIICVLILNALVLRYRTQQEKTECDIHLDKRRKFYFKTPRDAVMAF